MTTTDDSTLTPPAEAPDKLVGSSSSGSLPVLDAEGLAKLWEGEAYAIRSQATRAGYYNMTTLSRAYAKADQLEKCALELRLLMAHTNQRQPEENAKLTDAQRSV